MDGLNGFDLAENSVAKRVGNITSEDSLLMQNAATKGRQSANRRGLINSSIAAGEAQRAILDAAVPIASQDSQQGFAQATQERDIEAQRELQSNDLGLREQIARWNIDTSERTAAAQISASFQASLAAQYQAILGNTELSSIARREQLDYITNQNERRLGLVEQFYGIDLEF